MCEREGGEEEEVRMMMVPQDATCRKLGLCYCCYCCPAVVNSKHTSHGPSISHTNLWARAVPPASGPH